MCSVGQSLTDLVNAVTYLTTRDDVDPMPSARSGTGGTAAEAPFCWRTPSTSQSPSSARCRSPTARTGCIACAWSRVAGFPVGYARRKVTTGEERMVAHAPRSWCPPPSARPPRSRPTWTVACRSRRLSSAEAICAYRPIDAERHAPPPTAIGVQGDATTPTDHAQSLYDAARRAEEPRHHAAPYDPLRRIRQVLGADALGRLVHHARPA